MAVGPATCSSEDMKYAQTKQYISLYFKIMAFFSYK